MARTFDGVGDEVRWSLGACNINANPNGLTMAVCMSRAADASWDALLGLHTSGGTATTSLEINTSNQMTMAFDAGVGYSSGSTTVTVSDGWCILVAHKPSGAAANVTFSKYVMSSGTWNHLTSTQTVGDGTAPGTGGTVRFGLWQGTDDLGAEVAAAAIWNRDLTQTEVEQLAGGLSCWLALAPAACWAFDQQATTTNINDLTGNGANQSSLTGTAVSASSVPGFTYGVSVVSPEFFAGALTQSITGAADTWAITDYLGTLTQLGSPQAITGAADTWAITDYLGTVSAVQPIEYACSAQALLEQALVLALSDQQDAEIAVAAATTPAAVAAAKANLAYSTQAVNAVRAALRKARHLCEGS